MLASLALPDASAPGDPSAPATTGAPAPATTRRALLVYALAAGLLTALDLVTKEIAFARIGERDVVEVIPGLLNLIQARNLGAAFSMMSGKIAVFIGIALLELLALTWFVRAGRAGGARLHVALGVVAAGVLGNLHDRVRLGYVRDFIDVYASNPTLAQWLWDRFGMTHWPTFNVADMCIVCGTIYLFVRVWREESGRAGGASRPA